MEDRDMKKGFCECVGKIADLVQGIENLKLSLLGEAVIDRKFDEAEAACGVNLYTQRMIKNYGVEDWKKGKEYYDAARAQLDLAAKQTLEQLLFKNQKYCKSP